MNITNIFKKLLPTWTGRIGLMEFEATGQGLFNKGAHYTGVVELGEVERVGNMSKVHVRKITGIDRPERIEKLIPEWIATNEITWLEGDTHTPEAPTPPITPKANKEKS